MRRPLLVLALLAALALPLAAPGSTPASADPGSCGWEVAIRGNQVNALYPDEAANYWVALLPIPVGGHIEIAGEYPHARYASLHTYDSKVAAIDGIADVEIQPDDGSSNPFVDGADRTVADRGYTVRVVESAMPEEGRAPNTLYAKRGELSEAPQAQRTGIAYRVYVTDRTADLMGAVSLPALTLVTADGDRTVLPECGDRSLPDAGIVETTAAAGAPGVLPEAVSTFEDGITWHRYTNVAATAVDAGFSTPGLDTVKPPLEGVAAQLPRGGFGENIHNAYVYAGLSWARGEVVVLRGKAPVVPATREGGTVFGSTGVDRDGDGVEDEADMRYWSMCSELVTSQYFACATDEEVPVDADGYYTIVVSTAAARPSNATLACGVTWLPAGPGHETIMLLRNMLPAPGFANAVQLAERGEEAEVMGEYHPTGEYLPSPEAFEARGCTGR